MKAALYRNDVKAQEGELQEVFPSFAPLMEEASYSDVVETAHVKIAKLHVYEEGGRTEYRLVIFKHPSADVVYCPSCKRLHEPSPEEISKGLSYACHGWQVKWIVDEEHNRAIPKQMWKGEEER